MRVIAVQQLDLRLPRRAIERYGRLGPLSRPDAASLLDCRAAGNSIICVERRLPRVRPIPVGRRVGLAARFGRAFVRSDHLEVEQRTLTCGGFGPRLEAMAVGSNGGWKQMATDIMTCRAAQPSAWWRSPLRMRNAASVWLKSLRWLLYRSCSVCAPAAAEPYTAIRRRMSSSHDA
eukprot:4879777-Prymnesium_polylepis.1